MGIKGLYSILISEPNRFGERLTLSPNSDIDIYIDAPSFLYHLFHIYEHTITNKNINTNNAYDARKKNDLAKYPICFQDIILSSSRIQDWTHNHNDCHKFLTQKLLPISPKIIYDLTISFCKTLKECIGPTSNIHFIFDGVASTHKVKQQIDRMKNVAIDIDNQITIYISKQRRSTSTSCSFRKRGCSSIVPHLMAEDAVIAAIKDLQSEMKGIDNDKQCGKCNSSTYDGGVYLHYAPWEAEGNIANLIDNQHELQRPHIVLSNDTDFLVFPSVQGIVPFHTLEYETYIAQDDVRTYGIRLLGWEYKRSKFVQAFGLQTHTDQHHVCSLLIFSTIAALAGCDYILEGRCDHSIIKARKSIIQSEIGGLRNKDRNNPSAKDVTKAVIRFVKHFVSQFETKNDDFDSKSDVHCWMRKLVEAITAIGLAPTLSVQKKKKTKNNANKNKKRHNPFSIEQEKHILTNALLSIRDIYINRDSELSAVEDYQLLPAFRYSQELRRLIRCSTIFFKPILQSRLPASNGTRSSLDSSLKYSCGLWKEPAFFKYRSRVYSLINCYFRHEGESESTITEYSQVHRMNCIDYEPCDVDIEAEMNVCKTFLSHKISQWDILEYAFFGLGDKRKIMTHRLRDSLVRFKFHLPLVVASVFLGQQDAAILLLMSVISTLDDKKIKELISHLMHTIIIDCQVTPDDADFITFQSRIQIALFHVKLGFEAIDCIYHFCLIDKEAKIVDDENYAVIDHIELLLSQINGLFCDNEAMFFLWSLIVQQNDNDSLLIIILECLDKLFLSEQEVWKWQELLKEICKWWHSTTTIN